MKIKDFQAFEQSSKTLKKTNKKMNKTVYLTVKKGGLKKL